MRPPAAEAGSHASRFQRCELLPSSPESTCPQMTTERCCLPCATTSREHKRRLASMAGTRLRKVNRQPRPAYNSLSQCCAAVHRRIQVLHGELGMQIVGASTPLPAFPAHETHVGGHLDCESANHSCSEHMGGRRRAEGGSETWPWRMGRRIAPLRPSCQAATQAAAERLPCRPCGLSRRRQWLWSLGGDGGTPTTLAPTRSQRLPKAHLAGAAGAGNQGQERKKGGAGADRPLQSMLCVGLGV